MRARLAVVLATSALACYAWACGGSDEVSTPEADDGGVVEPDAGGTGTEDSGSAPKDGGNTTPDTGAPDAGDGGAVIPSLCSGNPFLTDGGSGAPDGGYLVDGGSARLLTEIQGFLDGPVWTDEQGGRLVFSDVYNADVRLLPDAGGASTQVRQFSVPPGNTLAPIAPIGNDYADGVLFSALVNAPGESPGIGRTLLDGGALGTLAVGAGVGSPNDLVIANGQRIYFTDPRYQAQTNGDRGVYTMLVDGGAFTPVDGGLYADNAPNGIALSPDRSKLYVSFTGNTGVNDFRVDAFAVGANGLPGNPQPFLASDRLAQAPDGLAVDTVGNLYVAEAASDGASSGRVEVFSATGVKWGALVFPNRRITGVAFGGADNTSLFITAEDAVYVFKNRCAGLR
jgi:sugar lactone lactonase YvrE